MAEKSVSISTYLFPIGLLLALVLAFWQNEAVLIAMGMIGLAVGFLNFDKTETQKGLLFIIAIGVTAFSTGMLASLGMIGSFLEPILLNITSFFTFAIIAMVVTAGFRILKD